MSVMRVSVLFSLSHALRLSPPCANGFTNQLHAAQGVVHEGVHAAEQPRECDLKDKLNQLSNIGRKNPAILCSGESTRPTTRAHGSGV